MLKSYLTVGLRTLARNRAFALINILGLAIGMAACILLLLFVRYETSYDQWLPGHERAYQVQTYSNDPENNRNEASQMTAYVVGTALAKDFPEIEKKAYLTQGRPVILQNGIATTGEVLMAEPDFLDIVQLPLVRGDRRTALKQTGSLLLTEAEAERRFPGVDPMGQSLSMIRAGKTFDYRVTGILKDVPRNSHLSVTMIVPFNPAIYVDQPNFFTTFGWNSGYVYVRLRPGATAASFAPRMAAWEARNIPKQNFDGAEVNDGDTTDWKLTPIGDVHLGAADRSGMTPSNDPRTITTFALVAVLILGMACINFVNLSTARAGQRAREVALRKTLGASRRQLIGQFLGESLVVSAIAMLVALALVELVLPSLSAFLKADLAMSYFGTGGILLPVLGLMIVVGLLAGLYPAFVLSRFEPAAVLKASRGSDPQGSGRLRSGLVIAQFAVSIALTICTGIVAAQTFYARSADAGYNRDGLLQVTGIGRKQLAPVADALVDAIARVPGVVAAGRTSIGVNTDSRINTTVRIDGNPRPIEIGNYSADPGYFDAIGAKFLAGRNLSKDIPRDDTQIPPNDPAAEAAFAQRGMNVVLSMAAVKKLGFPTADAAVGKTFRGSFVDDRFGLVPVTIIGVFPDMRLRSFREPYEPLMFSYDRSYQTELLVRLPATRAGEVRDAVEAVWKRYAPQVPFEAQFADDIIAAQYDADEARAKSFAAFAGLAIFVACLGLYGLAAFTAERRTKEIGIRKVLGARTQDIVRLLVWQFSKPVMLANFIAWPVAWWLMRDWLNSFADRITLGPQWFIGAGVLALVIATATIIGHAIRVARANPIHALRYE